MPRACRQSLRATRHTLVMAALLGPLWIAALASARLHPRIQAGAGDARGVHGRPGGRAAVQMRATYDDPYGVLNVPRGCTVSDARKAFREAAMVCHPDVCDAPDAAAQFMRVKAAFDSVLRSIALVPSARGASPAAGTTPQQTGKPKKPDIYDADMESFMTHMEEAWTKSRSVARKRWETSEALKEREAIKHKRSKLKKQSRDGGRWRN
ncbi:hypothetical protein T492DRAFT_1097270 [Pavlovales sp. CCMP2436]|nr:hypothetical protein T492DRAFT_1097270 [Pavlovales sp. CCMP2436]